MNLKEDDGEIVVDDPSKPAYFGPSPEPPPPVEPEPDRPTAVQLAGRANVTKPIAERWLASGEWAVHWP